VSDYPKLAELEVSVDRYDLEQQRVEVGGGFFTRVTTTVVLRGGGEEGRGEDVTYEADEHDGFPPDLDLAGRQTVADFSARLEPHELSDFRRWAFESAVLDLALRQAGRSLGDVVSRPYRPVRFVVSTRAEIRPWLEVNPSLEFKLDPTGEWTRELIEELAGTDRVRVVDFKSYYEGDWMGPRPGVDVYRNALELLPEAIVEDPGFTDETRNLLLRHADRLSFDAPIHSVEDVQALEAEPRVLNIKPSRFGTLERLFTCLGYSEERGMRLYGGGQFELGVGRSQIQALASLYYADGPNDVAPSAYNEGGPRPGLPSSPIEPPTRPRGFSLDDR
jgi:hypothetical protein